MVLSLMDTQSAFIIIGCCMSQSRNWNDMSDSDDEDNDPLPQ